MTSHLSAFHPPSIYRGPVFLWFVVIGNAFFGSVFFGAVLFISVGADAQSPGDGWSVPIAILVALVATGWVGFGSFWFHWMYLHRRPNDGRRVSTTTVDGAPAVVLTWRTSYLVTPLLGLSYTVAVGCLFAAVLLADGESGGWAGIWLAAAMALCLPDALFRFNRASRLMLTPEGIGARGWDGDSWLAWDDVGYVGFVDHFEQYTTLRVEGSPDAPSWRWKRRPRFLFLARQRGPFIDIPGPAIDIDPSSLADVVRYYARHERARAELTTDAARLRILQSTWPAFV